MRACAFLGLKRYSGIREFSYSIHVDIIFKIQAALELTALTGQFLGIQGKLLDPGCLGRDRLEPGADACGAA